MSSIEWKDDRQLINHYNKHVKGINLEEYNKEEPNIWKKYNNSIELTIEKYKEISKENIGREHYLCKDKSSNTFSINYYNSYDDEDYLLTCTKLNKEGKNIYSCYYTDKEHIHPFMNIYYFINNLKKINTEKYISKEFTKYEINENKFDKYLKGAIKECNLDNPIYTETEEITLLQMGILKQFLQDNSYSKKNNRIIWINKILYKKIDSIISNKDYVLTKEENQQLKNIYFEINKYKNSRESYFENKDAIDLLIEINNLINDVNYINFLESEISRWEMFNEFKKWKK